MSLAGFSLVGCVTAVFAQSTDGFDPQAMIVRTPRAMSAIRGTNPGFDVDADSGTENFFNLPDTTTGTFGSFSVTSTATGEAILLSGVFDVFLLDESGNFTAPLDLSSEDISNFFTILRAIMPPQSTRIHLCFQRDWRPRRDR